MTQLIDVAEDVWHQKFLSLQREHVIVLNQLSIALQRGRRWVGDGFVVIVEEQIFVGEVANRLVQFFTRSAGGHQTGLPPPATVPQPGGQVFDLQPLPFPRGQLRQAAQLL